MTIGSGRSAGLDVAAAWLLAASLLSGCEEDAPAEGTTASAATGAAAAALAADVRARTEASFDRAVFLKPDPARDPGFDRYLAPLLVVEVEEGAAAPPVSIGALVSDGEGGLAVDTERPAVYFESTSVVVGGREHDRLEFLWYFARPGAAGRPAPIAGVQGVRVTFDSRGFPVAEEVLADRSGLRVLHVAESLEKAAAREHGGALPGKRFALEPEEACDPPAVVARVFRDGPAPMGPFVYLRGDHEVTTLLCRCEPSRFKEVAADGDYELIPLEELPGEAIEEPAWSPAGGEWLEQALRLPPDF